MTTFTNPGATPIRVGLDAEILTCADTGTDELILNNETVTANELRTRINDARYRLAAMEALANAYEMRRADASPCFDWCSYDGRHPGEHESAPVWLAIPAEVVNPLNQEPLELVEAVLYYGDDSSTGVSVNPPGGLDGAMLHGREVDDFADSLIAFAARIRRMERLAAEADKARAKEAQR